MEDLLDLLDFLAPRVSDSDIEDKQRALEVAEKYRPWCLPEDKADEAQIWYAAWLLWNRVEQERGISYGARRKKEQSLEIEYGAGGQTDDPNNYLARFKSLEDLCALGAITAAEDRCGCNQCAR